MAVPTFRLGRDATSGLKIRPRDLLSKGQKAVTRWGPSAFAVLEESFRRRRGRTFAALPPICEAGSVGAAPAGVRTD